MVFESFSEKETFCFAKNIAKKAKKGDIYAIIGEMGAGKTAFSKGFAKGLEIKDEITSPTFSILNIYNSNPILYHFDLYRIKTIEELYDIGYFEYIYDTGICLIEWANIINDIIPSNANIIEIIKINDTSRRIILKWY